MCLKSTQKDKRLNLKFKQQEGPISLNGIRMLYESQNYFFLFLICALLIFKMIAAMIYYLYA